MNRGDMNGDIDVTEFVDFQFPDDELLPLTKCVCGKKFRAWDFIISIYRNDPYTCESCGRGLYFRNNIRVYEVQI